MRACMLSGRTSDGRQATPALAARTSALALSDSACTPVLSAERSSLASTAAHIQGMPARLCMQSAKLKRCAGDRGKDGGGQAELF